MRIIVDIADQLVTDLAAFQGKETLTSEELSALVQATLVEKASQFVSLSADASRAAAHAQIEAAAAARREEITLGISVSAEVV
jgi:hypothetical protein